MSITQGLNNAISGLTASARMAEAVSSNIANAMTEGYGRRQVDLSVGMLGGVQVDGVSRKVDQGVISQRRLSDAEVGAGTTLANMQAQLEKLISGTESGAGIADRLSRLEAAMITAAGDPASEVEQANLLRNLSGTAQAFNTASKGVQTLRVQADGQIASQIDQLNTSLRQVEKLNADILRMRNAGQDVSGLLDERQRVVDRISSIVPVRELDRQGGKIALMTTAGEVLIDGRAQQYVFTPAPVITADMTLGSGALSGITRADGTMTAADGIRRLSGGSLGAAFAMRDEVLVGAQAGLDSLAGDLVLRFQDPAVDPTLAPGDAGLFTDAGLAFDILDTEGISGRIAINAAVDPSQGGNLWRLRDGLNAAAPGPSGDATQLNRARLALADSRSIAGFGPAASAQGLASTLLSRIGTDRLAAEDELAFSTARWSSLHQAELAGGVDTDHEMQMLIRIEQSYAANAKLVQTIESMVRTLMEI